MFTLIKNDATKLAIEEEIRNSNIEYNLIAYNKELLTDKDIMEEYTEALTLQIERYLVKKMMSTSVFLIMVCLVLAFKSLG